MPSFHHTQPQTSIRNVSSSSNSYTSSFIPANKGSYFGCAGRVVREVVVNEVSLELMRDFLVVVLDTALLLSASNNLAPRPYCSYFSSSQPVFTSFFSVTASTPPHLDPRVFLQRLILEQLCIFTFDVCMSLVVEAVHVCAYGWSVAAEGRPIN
ncbi:hypothetical protein G7K_5141-t1 [Saitoella complicata NRRL Y-17804]|uniref:Uncharacterized protein n=1 Tax=Saitoella complicata (strain BCRC 22490 / CBS 7301 / JCM 7358 / NBRC 10748 / NRRL Y-17804) TaxID=698492 RepID=A0A0E9NMG2_SAICN|nr:hypothetical protein G7K_5141-t1 [Saitoella complicata NRRL Y-17804]